MGFGELKKDGGIKDVFGALPNMELQYNREVSADPALLTTHFSTYGGINGWSSVNKTIVGTTTTLLDYGGTHDLANPAASNQPTLNSADAAMNGYDTLTYDGTNDYNYKAVTNWRSADTQGVFSFTFIYDGTGASIFGTAKETDNNRKIQIFIGVANKIRIILSLSAGIKRVFDLNTTTLVSGSIYTVVLRCKFGVSYAAWINGVAQTLIFTTGSNDGGVWTINITGRNNITVGAVQQLSPNYYSGKFGQLFYYPYTDDTTAQAIGTDLINILHP